MIVNLSIAQANMLLYFFLIFGISFIIALLVEFIIHESEEIIKQDGFNFLKEHFQVSFFGVVFLRTSFFSWNEKYINVKIPNFLLVCALWSILAFIFFLCLWFIERYSLDTNIWIIKFLFYFGMVVWLSLLFFLIRYFRSNREFPGINYTSNIPSLYDDDD